LAVWEGWTYHVEVLEALLETDSARETVLDSGADDEAVAGKLGSELGCCLLPMLMVRV